MSNISYSVGGAPSLPGGVQIHFETIDPTRAAELLELNANPRKARATRIDQYGADMVAGKWRPYTSMIVIDTDGKLRDGQHRCAAAVKFQVAFPSLVLYGATDDVVDNLDQGLKRTNADVLRAHGELNHLGLAAAINVCRAWDRGELYLTKPTTPTQAAEYLEANPGLRQAVSTASNLSSSPLRMRISAAAALAYRLRIVDGAQADVFLQQILHGVGLAEDDSAFRYRQWLLTKSVTAYGRPSREMEIALGVKAWNNFITGKPTKSLRWARGGARRTEDFPVLLQSDGTAYPFPEVVARAQRVAAGDDHG